MLGAFLAFRKRPKLDTQITDAPARTSATGHLYTVADMRLCGPAACGLRSYFCKYILLGAGSRLVGALSNTYD